MTKTKKKYPEKNKLVICDFCNKEYYVTTQIFNLINSGKRKFKACSRECQHELEKVRRAKERELWPVLICDWCGKEYRVSPFTYKQKTSDDKEFQVCSKACCQKYLGKKHKEDADKRHEEEWEHSKCEVCGKEILIDPTKTTPTKYCSRKCQGIAKTQRATIYLTCKNCGKEFSALKGQNDFWGGLQFCSKKCSGEYRKEGATLNCVICGKEYWVHNSQIEKSVCCSRECIAKWQSQIYSKLPEVQERLQKQGTTSHLRTKTSYTKPELIMLNYLESKNINFIPQYIIGDKLTADFYFPEYNCVLEVYGDYWHSNPKKYGDGEGLYPLNDIQIKNKQKDIRRYKVITKNYNMLFYSIWEYDIEHDLDNAVNKFFNYIDSKIRNEQVVLQ